MKTSEKKTKKKNNSDLPDSKDDVKHLQAEETILDLPDVKDIPGQEHIRPLITGELADTTISSADEEVDELLNEDDDEKIEQYNSNVTKDERSLLRRSAESMETNDDQQLTKSALDKVDDDGTLLNEKTDLSGRELDVPGSEEDDNNEDIGEEDEENNSYSLNDDKEEDDNSRQ